MHFVITSVSKSKKRFLIKENLTTNHPLKTLRKTFTNLKVTNLKSYELKLNLVKLTLNWGNRTMSLTNVWSESSWSIWFQEINKFVLTELLPCDQFSSCLKYKNPFKMLILRWFASKNAASNVIIPLLLLISYKITLEKIKTNKSSSHEGIACGTCQYHK